MFDVGYPPERHQMETDPALPPLWGSGAPLPSRHGSRMMALRLIMGWGSLCVVRCIPRWPLASRLSACAIQRAQVANEAQNSMIGLSKEQILACMGPPANQAAVGATEVWSYNSGNGRATAFVSGDRISRLRLVLGVSAP